MYVTDKRGLMDKRTGVAFPEVLPSSFLEVRGVKQALRSHVVEVYHEGPLFRWGSSVRTGTLVH